ncbi:MAG TPA: LamG domain-containing protein [Gammaproteobacteria bacterium]
MSDVRPAVAGAMRAAFVALAAAALAACGGGSGAAVEQNPSSAGPGAPTYNGPPPATEDVQSFKLNLWDHIQASNRCGACHSVEGGQAPLFARRDDINLAYSAANGVVSLAVPDESLMVTKVAGGHNCWLSSDAVCAEILTTWISNWAGTTGGASGRKIDLEPPVLRDPGASKSFPADPSAFGATVYALVTGKGKCYECHSSASAAKQSPLFAEGPVGDANALATAYAAAKAKINLDDPGASRLVVRLRDESHNCWTASCEADAAEMEAAIAALAAGIQPTQVDPSLVTSKALTLYEGTIAAGGNRHEANVIALWEFKEGAGNTAHDTSGIEPAMDLTISGDVDWFSAWGLTFTDGKAQASTAASAKLRTLIGATGEYSIEAWVAPGNVVQEDRRIVSYSAGLMARNFNLGQTMYSYDFFNRTTNSDENGNPQLSTPDAAEVLQATLQHVVATYSPTEGRKIYVNGELVTQPDPVAPGLLTDWDDTYAFVLGNEVSGDRPWAGVIRLVAIHNRALTPAQIVQNYEVGVGEKFFLLFGVEHLTNVPQSFVVFEAAQFDDHAYLFRKPFFISLDPNAQPSGIELQGIRIGINGSEAPVGQAFANITATIGNGYSPETGQPLATLGTVLPLDKGPESDEFFLTFDRLGGHAYNRQPPPSPAPPGLADNDPVPLVGVRTFDEINATMAAITGVSMLDPTVQGTFNLVRESLPSVDTLEAFLASHQVAIAQLAIEYCNAMVEDPAFPSRFPGFLYNDPVAVAWPGAGSASENAFIDPLLDRVLAVQNGSLTTQPSRTEAREELDRLVHGIPGDSTRPGLAAAGGDAEQTRTIAKAVCAAVVGSAAMLVQ